jgi:hypothetical protein
MTDDFICPVAKSHPKSAREFCWELMSTGETRAAVYCTQHEAKVLIDVIGSPELYSDLLPRNPFPQSMKPML